MKGKAEAMQTVRKDESYQRYMRRLLDKKLLEKSNALRNYPSLAFEEPELGGEETLVGAVIQMANLVFLVLTSIILVGFTVAYFIVVLKPIFYDMVLTYSTR